LKYKNEIKEIVRTTKVRLDRKEKKRKIQVINLYKIKHRFSSGKSPQTAAVTKKANQAAKKKKSSYNNNMKREMVRQ